MPLAERAREFVGRVFKYRMSVHRSIIGIAHTHPGLTQHMLVDSTRTIASATIDAS
jgi:hypothetical protein